MSILKLSKYDCEKTYTKLQGLVSRIPHQNLKTDYNKIMKHLDIELQKLIKLYPVKTTKNNSFYTLNYKMEKHIEKVNKIL